MATTKEQYEKLLKDFDSLKVQHGVVASKREQIEKAFQSSLEEAKKIATDLGFTFVEEKPMLDQVIELNSKVETLLATQLATAQDLVGKLSSAIADFNNLEKGVVA